jgi:excisionase family DNA binding protein
MDMSKHKLQPAGPPITLDDLLSVEQAAEQIGIKPGTVYKYFGRGLLRKTRHGPSVWVHRDEVDRYLQERREPGRPRPLA